MAIRAVMSTQYRPFTSFSHRASSDRVQGVLRKALCRSYSQVSLKNRIQVLQPGLIHIKEGLSEKEQTELCTWARKRGDVNEGGFWKKDKDGFEVLNQAPEAPYRGRVFDVCPASLQEYCLRFSTLAGAVDKSIKPCLPTHYILLMYKTLEETPKSGYIPWHQDKDPNDGEEDKPVVSFSFGDTREFLVCNGKPSVSKEYPLSNPRNLAHRIRLDSGDVLIFGGPSRKIHHAIYKMERNCPDYLNLYFPDYGVYNITFRSAPAIDTNDYVTGKFKSVYSKKG